ncbi:hypothetical protein LCGC14_3056830 [marine sediment metagenome]|uniref:Uncharacterized protein n=1 Tax=marine sediment metagenome TaxID=412755 RepID=A0A0F8ZAU6_9ZZZZ
MIEGLHFDIKFKEMKDHLEAKANHHFERKQFYFSQAQKLEEGNAEAMNYSGGDPVKVLKDKGNNHYQRMGFFQFMADHLVEGVTYRLSENDLMTLEFISRYFR